MVAQDEGERQVRRADGKVVPLRTKTEPRCKICMHPKRIAIEELMVKQVNREDDPDGVRITFEYIMEYAEREWGLRLTKENLRVHREAHFGYQKMVERSARQIQNQSDKLLQISVLAEMMDRLDVEATINELICYGLNNVRQADGANVTIDHLLKALDLKQKRGERGQVDEVWKHAAVAVNINLGPTPGGAKVVENMEDVVDVTVEEEVA